MLRAFIDDRRCLHCEECEAAKACPSMAIFKLDPEEPAVIEVKFCYGCGECVEQCANNAISLKNKLMEDR